MCVDICVSSLLRRSTRCICIYKVCSKKYIQVLDIVLCVCVCIYIVLYVCMYIYIYKV